MREKDEGKGRRRKGEEGAERKTASLVVHGTIYKSSLYAVCNVLTVHLV